MPSSPGSAQQGKRGFISSHPILSHPIPRNPQQVTHQDTLMNARWDRGHLHRMSTWTSARVLALDTACVLLSEQSMPLPEVARMKRGRTLMPLTPLSSGASENHQTQWPPALFPQNCSLFYLNKPQLLGPDGSSCCLSLQTSLSPLCPPGQPWGHRARAQGHPCQG